MIYLVVFFLSCIFLYASDRHKGVEKKLYAFIGLLLPIMLATLRSEYVGIDVSTYIKPVYLCAKGSPDILKFYSNLSNSTRLMEVDWGYALIVYIATKLFKSLWGVFLLNELLVIIPVFFAINNFNIFYRSSIEIIYGKEKRLELYYIPTWLGMFWFYILFYNNSLNQVRQAIACALCLLTITLLLNCKYKKAIISSLLGISVHASGIMVAPLIALYYIFKRNKRLTRYVIYIFLLSIMVSGKNIIAKIFTVLYSHGIITMRYYGQILGGGRDNNINWSWLYICILMIVVLYFIPQKDKEKDWLRKYLFCISFTAIALIPFSGAFNNLGRVMLYFLYFAILIMPQIYHAIYKKILEYRAVSLIFSLILGLIHWFVGIFLLDYTGTIAYTFFWNH